MFTIVLALSLAAAPDAKLTDWKNGVRELRFTDKAGEHLVKFVLSDVKKKKSSEGWSKSRDLLVTHTIGKKQIWQAKDFVQQCEFDLQLEVVDGSIEVSDVDENGQGEVSFLYRLGCRSDVSPDGMKLLMYEGPTKFALRGESKERVSETEFMGGEFQADPAFDKAPAVFLDFATAKWKRLVTDVK
ncbi:MAG: M949_RS01915 family surface polysaccharide biosynthesis protein [Archangium sp.]